MHEFSIKQVYKCTEWVLFTGDKEIHWTNFEDHELHTNTHTHIEWNINYERFFFSKKKYKKWTEYECVKLETDDERAMRVFDQIYHSNNKKRQHISSNFEIFF